MVPRQHSPICPLHPAVRARRPKRARLAAALLSVASTLGAFPAAAADGTPAPLHHVLPSSSTQLNAWQHYGAAFSLPRTATHACTDLLANLAAQTNQLVRVRGRMTEICQTEGCWLSLSPLDQVSPVLRVTVKDRAFSIDVSADVSTAGQAAGRVAEVEGVLIAAQPNPATDSSGYQLVASTVRLWDPQ